MNSPEAKQRRVEAAENLHISALAVLSPRWQGGSPTAKVLEACLFALFGAAWLESQDIRVIRKSAAKLL